ncbi:hypothetical protein [Kytococcus sp. HMSC28H12]|uniref:hypothetical protein n=1 Tax=Kytococcus sp. HMSC28H12 TaxID=1581067 RepID=UPI0008A1B22D|nr:hypothetical protein [Kytococcus sp. HMSC28H12]OFS15021.1 hypothetical protein HMPREF3099_02970 [Kytococcus sp. HMSC28H12]
MFIEAITALSDAATVGAHVLNTSIELVRPVANTSIELDRAAQLANTSIELANTSIEIVDKARDVIA